MRYKSLASMLAQMFVFKEQHPESEIIPVAVPSTNMDEYLIGYYGTNDKNSASWYISVSDSQNSCWKPWKLNMTMNVPHLLNEIPIDDWSGLHSLEEVHNHIKSCPLCLPDFVLNE